jgi:chromosome segregation ATPase
MRAAKLHALWCASVVPVVCQRPSPRRLDEAEDRVRAAAAAAAASEASHARQAKALVKFASDAAEARARVQELEVTCQQQAASLQARMQSEGQMEETIRQLQQVLPRTCCHLVLAFD